MFAHSDKLERWLGSDTASHLSSAMRGFYGPPVQVAIGDGAIRVTGDGDFLGSVMAGGEASYADWVADREVKARKQRVARAKRQLGAISSFSGLIQSIGGGKKQMLNVAKTGVTGVANISNTLWDVGAQPQAGSTSAAPSGSSPDNTTTGGLLYSNAGGSDSMYFLGATMVPTVGNNLLLLYDRYFQANHNIATDPQAISGTPGRYQSTAAKGGFISIHVTTALGAGTPTLTLTYVDQDGNTAETATAQTIVGSAIARRFPFASSVGNGWYIPLNSSDNGVRSLTNSDLSAASTGNIDIILGMPVAWIPQPIANMPVVFDASISPAVMQPIAASACLALMEINKGATTATSYSGSISLVSG